MAEGEQTRIEAAPGAPVVLPADDALLTAEFVRDGADLILQTPDGRSVVVEGYFGGAAPQDLMIAGAVVPGRVVGKLARDPRPEPETETETETASADAEAAQPENAAPAAPEAPGQLAAEATVQPAAFVPLGDPIAQVGETAGQVTAIRADGRTVVLKPGDALYVDDILQTSADGSVGVVFVDGMSFSLSKGGRMVLDEFVYSAETETGGGLFSVVQGAFSFVSGKAAHTAPDALMIETPTMTIGVRGTKVVAEIAADGSATKVALLAEEDGAVGKIMVSTDAGAELIDVANRMVETFDRGAPPSAQRAVSSTDLADGLGAALDVLPAPTTLFAPTRPIGAEGPAIQEARATTERSEDRGEAGADAAETPAANPVPTQTAAQAPTRSAQPAESARADADLRVAESVQPKPADPIATGDTPARAAPTVAAIASAEKTESEIVREALDQAALAADEDAKEEEEEVVEEEPAANSAPTLDASGAPSLGAGSEDGGVIETTVANFVADGSIVDADGAVEAIAVTGVDLSGGSWTYSIDGGASFKTLVALEEYALLLGPDAIIRFAPNADFNGEASLAYRAWDQSAGIEGGLADATVNGGSTAFSAASETATVAVAAVNDAPVLDVSGDPAFAAIQEDDGASEALAVSALVEGFVADVDGAAVEAIALTSADQSFGVWRVSFDGGASFADVGDVSESAALLLGPDAQLRFVPNADASGAATIGFRAWDRSTGSEGAYADASVNGGTSAFSAAAETASVAVSAVNDAPVVVNAADGALVGTTEDAAAPTGTSVRELISGRVSDADGAAADAIALTAANETNGTWQVSYDAGASYANVGAVSDAAALLLDGDALLRFVPDADFNGTAEIGFRAWDGSTGAVGDKLDASAAGGETAFSTAAIVATLAVSAVNDAPVLDVSGAPSLGAVDEDAGAVTGAVSSFVGDATTDLDAGALQGIAVTGVSGDGVWEYFDGAAYQTLSPTEAAARLLPMDAQLRFTPAADANGTASLVFRAWDQTSGTSYSVADATSAGGATAFSAAAETVTVQINAVNDAPVLDASGAPMLSAGLMNADTPWTHVSE
ncbi:MAG: FecR domain-containing protein, partial [Pseudomonadota bacterium]